ncbi:MAG TPA: thermonuclease family protein [Burkholderiaceae bacterium]|nr:thermonuclease family protein [Burkholderiaceae bacterium]
MKTKVWVMAATGLLCAGLAMAATKNPKPAKEPPAPIELTGMVSRVVDGDTLWLKTAADEQPVIVRIEGIDAPEACQPGGAAATSALAELALNRSVTVKPTAVDDYGRKVGKVFDGSKDIGDRMVRDGHAWSTRYKYDRGPYVAEERMAQSLKRGLHAEAGALQPRLFRERHGPCPGEAGKPGSSLAPPAAPLTEAPRAVTVAASPSRRCDGRQYCSQMTSCDEAKWFLQNCPGAKMDGNRDGVPCEQQWCGRR